LKQRFPKLIHLGEKAGIDPHTSPLLIYPTLHYQNGGVAHDLNNILSGIVSYPELLLLEIPEDSPLRKPLP